MRTTLTLVAAILAIAPSAQAQSCGSYGLSEALFLGSAAFDIVTAPVAAIQYNKRHFAVVPTFDPGQRRAGLAVSWTPGARARDAHSYVAQESAPRIRKSPTEAFLWSAVGTALPITLGVKVKGAELFALGGLILGPGLGHLYLNDFIWFLGGAALRSFALYSVFCGYT